MSLQTRLEALVAAIGADIKQLKADVQAASGDITLDGGNYNETATEVHDAGAIA